MKVELKKFVYVLLIKRVYSPSARSAIFSFLIVIVILIAMATTRLKKSFCFGISQYEVNGYYPTCICRKFENNPLSKNSVCIWYTQFTETGCLYKGKPTGHPSTSVDDRERVLTSFVQSPHKSTRNAARQLNMPITTAWRVLYNVLPRWWIGHASEDIPAPVAEVPLDH